MPMLVDIKAFLATARLGGFSAAGREIGTAPSVVAKRVNRLEHEIGTKLFVRTTRKLSLTPDGQRLRPQVQTLVSELDETLRDLRRPGRDLGGALRVHAPTAIGTVFVGPSIARFQRDHPDVKTELSLTDRSVNPLEDGYDIAFGDAPQTFPSVEATMIASYPQLPVAAPAYLDRRGIPDQPGELAEHDCIAFVASGLTWTFVGPQGPMPVEIHPRFTVNDSRLLADAAEQGIGVTVVPEFVARTPIAEGRLVPLLPDWPLQSHRLVAMVPSHKAGRPEVAALVDHVRTDLDPAPWH